MTVRTFWLVLGVLAVILMVYGERDEADEDIPARCRKAGW